MYSPGAECTRGHITPWCYPKATLTRNRAGLMLASGAPLDSAPRFHTRSSASPSRNLPATAPRCISQRAHVVSQRDLSRNAHVRHSSCWRRDSFGLAIERQRRPTSQLGGSNRGRSPYRIPRLYRHCVVLQQGVHFPCSATQLAQRAGRCGDASIGQKLSSFADKDHLPPEMLTAQRMH